MKSTLLSTLLSISFALAALSAPSAASTAERVPLKDGWFIHSSADVPERGDAISRSEFEPRDWYRATVPSTVMAALVKNRVYADPYFGQNLRSIPGVNYPIGHNFSNISMPPGSPFRSSWWYRTRFTVPAGSEGKRILLHFDGINFRANVWLNGRRLAGSDQVAGSWRLFEFDVTDALASGKPNVLAVEVFPPTPHDLAITFVDWNPTPPDKAMGIWRDVYLTVSGPVSIRFPHVITKLDLPATRSASLTVTAELRNLTDRPVSGTLTGRIESLSFSQPVNLEAKQTTVVTFTPGKFSQLNIANPRLWWLAQLGPQNLYDLNLTFETMPGTISDQARIRFGIREITSQLDNQGGPTGLEGLPQSRLRFMINGKNILIRGAGYTFDMLLRSSPEKQEAELRYVRDMNLNTVRLEGKIEDDNFLRLADEYGILVMTGWCCCDHWEKWRDWDDEDRAIAAASLRDQIRRLRSHPSVFDWMNGSDGPPPPDIEQMYIGILKEASWPNPYQSSATAKPTTETGETGVKMTGPYEYVAPSYWLLDTQRGGAHGFNTETSPGPAVPPIDSLRLMLPPEHLWPIDSWWGYHAGGGAFADIRVFTAALNHRYGKAASTEDFAMKSQVLAYEGERAMFEAFGRNKYVATGVIHWMLNNAWPSMIWHLYDYYLRPGGGYFGAKKACEPLHIQYSYDDRSIAVVNSYYNDFKGLKAAATVYNLDLSEKFTRTATVDVPADGVQKPFVIPNLDGLSPTYFVRLSLTDASGKLVSSNFYWLSTKPETLDWDNSTWFVTPTKTYADLTGLADLPKVGLNVTASSEIRGDEGITRITVENPARSLAFAVHLQVSRPAKVHDPESDPPDSEILPVLWQDNYFPLFPGEKREITATYRKADMGTTTPVVHVDGWNVVPK